MKFAAIFGLALLLPIAAHATDYPTVKEIETGLNMPPGAQWPRDLPARGKGWHIFYLQGHALGNGYYDVRIKLR